MIASRLFALAVAAFTGATMVAATPVAAAEVAEKRQTEPIDQIITILTALDAQTNAPVAGIGK